MKDLKAPPSPSYRRVCRRFELPPRGYKVFIPCHQGTAAISPSLLRRLVYTAPFIHYIYSFVPQQYIPFIHSAWLSVPLVPAVFSRSASSAMAQFRSRLRLHSLPHWQRLSYCLGWPLDTPHRPLSRYVVCS